MTRSPTWYRLRETRSNRPGKAQRGRAGKIFGAGFEQFEQLMTAAELVGVASRPMLLYYGIAQAGRALVAASFGEEPTGHGLTFVRGAGHIMSWTVKEDGRNGLFQAVRRLTNASPLDGPVQLAALWCSLPPWADSGAEFPSALRVDEYPVIAWGRPEVAARALRRVTVQLQLSSSPEHVLRHWNAYPTLRGWQVAATDESVLRKSLEWSESYLEIWHPREVPLDISSHVDEEGDSLIERLAPRLPIGELSDRWVRPQISTSGEVPSLLVTWWLLLYGLSMICQYYPSEWVAGLDVDSDREAANLEQLLDFALEAVPRVILDEIHRQHTAK